MTRVQKGIIGIGLVAVLAMCVFPPSASGSGWDRYGVIWEIREIGIAVLAVQILAVGIVIGGLVLTIRTRRTAVIAAVILAIVLVISGVMWGNIRTSDWWLWKTRSLSPTDLTNVKISRVKQDWHWDGDWPRGIRRPMFDFMVFNETDRPLRTITFVVHFRNRKTGDKWAGVPETCWLEPEPVPPKGRRRDYHVFRHSDLPDGTEYSVTIEGATWSH